jgi:hypothetical protein
MNVHSIGGRHDRHHPDRSLDPAPIADLHGRTAFITGGNSGVGLETARVLTAHGAHVILAGRNQDKLDEAVAEIRNVQPDARLRASGAKWNDRISSMTNNQSTGTRANFYNGEGSWKLVFWTYAYDWRANLGIDKRYGNGGQLNDIIDRVVPC